MTKITTAVGELEDGKKYAKLHLQHGTTIRMLEKATVRAFHPYADEVRYKLEQAAAVGAPLTKKQIEDAVEASETRYEASGIDVVVTPDGTLKRPETVGFQLEDVVEFTE